MTVYTRGGDDPIVPHCGPTLGFIPQYALTFVRHFCQLRHLRKAIFASFPYFVELEVPLQCAGPAPCAMGAGPLRRKRRPELYSTRTMDNEAHFRGLIGKKGHRV